ncbi:MAG: carbamoyl phosphate synthase small subunit [Rhodospirillales bacterium RIFCSPLOWO2_12_FULL_58_28]|nr:MAG: carbamoyl phosphate synthase small subunit [Rhodospirillales bacterium RIFCSPLOWO2_02_FULL_58_16]OHC76671.1 MAG: carbamoyl phosphate synthase small subunit [Rhodospirillales bacterium RIFCSPLOWO2_12_FULL_58_28]
MSAEAAPHLPAPKAVRPPQADAALVLADGSVYWGQGLGAVGVAVGEVCFNTSITGYQEILTDPSYAGQIITFTFPHIGNVGANPEDIESRSPAVRGCVLRSPITEPSNWRAAKHLNVWLKARNLVALAGVDTRRLTRRIRDGGAPNGALIHLPDENIDTDSLQTMARAWPGLAGMDLAKEVTCLEPYEWWDEGEWSIKGGYVSQKHPRFNVVAVDFGAKRNILRCLAAAGCAVSVVPASASAEEVLGRKPDGVFLSNGPGDPAATAEYALPMIKAVMESGTPLFGICLGHQLMALALGCSTHKMHMGHRGANHPVKDLETGKVEITSQNHGFVVDRGSLPKGVIETHVSLFDGSPEGIRVEGKPAFSVQYHPEASPGPQDSRYLFERFTKMMELNA